MTVHLFANIVTDFGTAANNRGETEGNTTTLQKLIWHGQIHTTVSAEAIRFAARQQLATFENGETNRHWNEAARTHEWRDATFSGFADANGQARTYIDDDLLGYMRADAAKEENTAGTASVRRAVLEVTRAVSLTPWSGDTTFNAASPGATPSAQKKGSNPVPYGSEIHATRYQFGIAMTPDRLRVRNRAVSALRAITSLRTVAGNHGRFLFDFAPAAIVIRITEDPAPRLLYCFDTEDAGKTIDSPELLRRVLSEDIAASELIIGGSLADTETGKKLRGVGAEVFAGIKSAMEAAARRLEVSFA